MMSMIGRALLFTSGSVELSIAAKATVVLATGLIATRLAHRARASMRHLILATTFVGLFALPLGTALLPRTTVLISMAHMSAPPSQFVAESRVNMGDERGASLPQRPAAVRKSRAPETAAVIRAIWLAGGLLFLMPVVAGLWRLRRIRRQSSEWSSEALLGDLAVTYGVGRQVNMRVHEHTVMPMMYGAWHPVIFLPGNIQDWSDDDVRHALAHELEHVRRWDWPVALIVRMLCTVYWFHPLAWMALRGLRLESERACDDAVLRSGDRVAYAEQLVTLARQLIVPAPGTMLAMANRDDLSTRVSAILDPTQARGRVRVGTRAIVVASGVCLSLALGGLTATQVHAQAAVAGASPRAFQSASIASSQSPLLPESAAQALLPPSRGEFVVRGASLGALIRRAYGLSPYEVSGGASWIESDPFDIVAEMPGDASQAQAGLMMQALLKDRFKLATHTERRTMPVYMLVRSPLYQGLGPSLVRSARDCAAEATLDLHAKLKLLADTGRPLCGDFQLVYNGTTRATIPPHYLGGRAVELSRLAVQLPTIGAVNRAVLDRTGLSGAFDLDLAWTPQPDNLPYETDPPSIFVAIERQLGLDLEPASVPGDVLVVDHAEKPSTH